MAYVLALPMDICEILMKFVIHILKALDISYTKMQEKIEITTNHLLQFWTKIPKNGYCEVGDPLYHSQIKLFRIHYKV